MKRPFAASLIVLVLFVGPLSAQDQVRATKKPITHDVYDGWKSIQA